MFKLARAGLGSGTMKSQAGITDFPLYPFLSRNSSEWSDKYPTTNKLL